MSVAAAQKNLKKSLEKGILKILSKVGPSPYICTACAPGCTAHAHATLAAKLLWAAYRSACMYAWHVNWQQAALSCVMSPVGQSFVALLRTCYTWLRC